MEITQDNYFEAAAGLYFYCSDYHGGQASSEYSVLSRLQGELSFRPGMSEPDEMAQIFYQQLEESKDVETFYSELKAFCDALED